MNYLLVSDKQELRDVVLTMTPDEGSTFSNAKEFTYSNVPVNRNYRTNIYGTLFTEQVKYKIAVKQNFNTPDYNVTYQPASAAELVSALSYVSDGDVIVPTEDIDLSEAGPVEINADITLKIPVGTTITTACQEGEDDAVVANIVVGKDASVTIDGGGTIEGDQEIIAVDGELTIENATLTTSEKFAGAAISVNEGGKLTVEEGTTIEAARFAIWAEGDVTFNGGSFTSSSVLATNSSGTRIYGGYCILVESKDANVVINDGYFQGAHGVIGVDQGKLTINGGVFAALKNPAATYDNYYALYVETLDDDDNPTECEVTINGGYFFRENTAGCFYHASGNENSKLIIQGGTFQNQGVNGGNTHTLTDGYEWKTLDSAETLEVNGTTLSFGYQVVKSAE
jgi:hypothetical protein